MNSVTPKRLLICPLDWGLGHASRCVPIIKALKQRGCEVVVASSGEALALLKIEFPQLEFHEIVSYRARYSVRLPFMINIFLQLPKFIKAIHQEHDEIATIIKEKKIDMVISDCRYGCWSSSVPAFFITHQINLLMPPRLNWMSLLINFFNRHQIRKFTRCWVPDFSANRITGKLSDSHGLNVDYVGMLSRFNSSSVTNRPKKYEVLAILSGPEPQRTKLEEILRDQLLRLDKRCLLVQGLVKGPQAINASGQLEVVNYLSSNDLQQVIEESNIIISRSGYSSIMDFARLGSNVIFVPTPGQTEQQYLAEQLERKGITFYMTQKEFDLPSALIRALQYKGFNNAHFPSESLDKAIDDLLK